MLYISIIFITFKIKFENNVSFEQIWDLLRIMFVQKKKKEKIMFVLQLRPFHYFDLFILRELWTHPSHREKRTKGEKMVVCITLYASYLLFLGGSCSFIL